jgi:uroporphyrinogen decarboxylase
MHTANINPKTSAGQGDLTRPAELRKASTRATLSDRERFLRACRCEPLDYPPIWLMRQAGRVLPEYRALKEKYSFAELIERADLAAEVTLQPVRRFGFDGAILFSDILVVPQAMGQSFHFREKGGIEMGFVVRSRDDIKRLNAEDVPARLQNVRAAIELLKVELGGKTALIGFSGSPWTLANFMMEGGSAKDYAKARHLFYSDRSAFDELCEKLTKAVTDYLQMQIDAGVDAIQIFDSLGGVLSAGAFESASGVWMRRIIESLQGRVPVIVFAKGAHGSLRNLASLKGQVLGMDWTVDMRAAAQELPPDIGVQGNLDPLVLETTPEAVATETKLILKQMQGRPGHIFNLGHGVPPSAKLECIESLVKTVRNSHEHA